MDKEIQDFYECLKELYTDVVKAKTKTISTEEFKEKATQIYVKWKTEIKTKLANYAIDPLDIDSLDTYLDDFYGQTKTRTANVSNLRKILEYINNLFLEGVIRPLENKKSEPHLDLMKSASFLGLDTNWSWATCALQLQEVAVILVAERNGIKLDKKGIERILGKKMDDSSFNYQYEAFSKEVKRLFNVDMPILTMHLRKMRVAVLHEGYNPTLEEKDSIVGFTIGLLQKLNSIKNRETQIN